MKRKANFFIAVKNDERDVPSRIFDMLRYDSCYPISNSPSGWIVLIQPHREGVSGGFTIGRWESFGFRGKNITGQHVGFDSFMPTELLTEIHSKDRQG